MIRKQLGISSIIVWGTFFPDECLGGVDRSTSYMYLYSGIHSYVFASTGDILHSFHEHVDVAPDVLNKNVRSLHLLSICYCLPKLVESIISVHSINTIETAMQCWVQQKVYRQVCSIKEIKREDHILEPSCFRWDAIFVVRLFGHISKGTKNHDGHCRMGPASRARPCLPVPQSSWVSCQRCHVSSSLSSFCLSLPLFSARKHYSTQL